MAEALTGRFAETEEGDTQMKRMKLNSHPWLGICLIALAFGAAADALPPRIGMVTLDIRSQPIGDALNEFGQQSGIQILLYSEVANDLTGPALVGAFTADEALMRLLSNTGLTYSRINERTVAIHRVDSTVSESKATRNEAALPAMRLANYLQISEGLSNDVVQETSSQEVGRENSSEERRKATLEEIVVTAQKRQERLQDVPISIAVITNQDIERRGLIGMEDYLRSIPGVNQIDQGPQSNAIVIRGITTSPEFENFFSGTTVASYFDETPITGAAGLGAGGIDVRPVDIERIEVLRGPQGTTYGSASLGGTMRMIPVKPKLDSFGGKLAASYSDTSGYGSGNWMGQAIVNVPVARDRFAMRVVGYRYDESGFYRNIAGIDPNLISAAEGFGLGDFVSGYIQDEVGRTVSTGGRLAALWQLTDKLNLSMNFLTQRIEQDGQPTATVGDYEQARLPVAPQGRLRGETGEVADSDMELANLVLSYDLGWAELISAASWVDGGSAFALTQNGLPYFPSFTGQSDFKSFTAETRIASQLKGRFQFLAGLFYEDVDDHGLGAAAWPGTAATNPVGTDPMYNFDNVRQIDQRAAFGEISYDLTDKLTATVGGRYFKYENDERSLTEGGLVGVPIGGGIPQVLGSSEDRSTFKANLSYKPTKDSLVYASWAEGFRLGRPAPGLPPALCDADNDGLVDGTSISIASTREVDSDFLENYEIGGKLTLFERRMVIDAAIYHIEWDGLPVTVRAPCSLAYTANVGAATSDGVEFQASLFLMDRLRLDFGGGYTKAELSKDVPSLLAQEGTRLPGSPQVSMNLAAQYDFDVAGHNAFLRADSLYVGEFYGDLLETLKAGDYIKVDARAGVTIRSLSLELFVSNLTNEDAVTWRSPSVAGTSYQLRPRTVGIEIDYRFGK